MLNQSPNVVRIEGILNEVDLREGSYVRDGQNVEYIAGEIRIKTVFDDKRGNHYDMNIPVQVFSGKTTRNNTLNPAYENLKKVKDEYISIAACGNEQEATRVRITNGALVENSFYATDGTLVTQNRISANFINPINKEADFKPDASFKNTIYILKINDAYDKDGIATGGLTIQAGVVQYGGKVDVITFTVNNPNSAESIRNFWHPGDTVNVAGIINFTSVTETIVENYGIGDDVESIRTVTKRELLINSGSPNGLDGDLAINSEEMQVALTVRKNRLEEQRTKTKTKTGIATPTTTSVAAASSLNDIDF